MKKQILGMAVMAGAMMAATAASAAVIQLGNIDTNNCARAESEVRLLNSRDVRVDNYCQFGEFAGQNGRIYRYRLQTSIEVPYRVRVGERIQLGNIDTDNCEAARSEIALLKSAGIAVRAQCEYGEFEGANGRIYSERLHTSIIVRNRAAIIDSSGYDY